MNRLIILANLLLLVASNVWAYSETDLAKLKELNACKGCDLRDADLRGADLNNADLDGADLRGVDLRGADLRTSILKNAKLDGVKLCKTQMPWGELNNDC